MNKPMKWRWDTLLKVTSQLTFEEEAATLLFQQQPYKQILENQFEAVIMVMVERTGTLSLPRLVIHVLEPSSKMILVPVGDIKPLKIVPVPTYRRSEAYDAVSEARLQMDHYPNVARAVFWMPTEEASQRRLEQGYTPYRTIRSFKTRVGVQGLDHRVDLVLPATLPLLAKYLPSVIAG